MRASACVRPGRYPGGPRRGWLAGALVLASCCSMLAAARAQAPGSWETGDPQRANQAPANTTVVPRMPGAGQPASGRGQVSMSAYLTDNSPPIMQGLIWRVFRNQAGKPALVSTLKEASPTLRLDPGTYYVNVALGRANLTRKIAISGDQPAREKFVLNAGGLRVVPTLAGGELTNDQPVTYDVESDERDEYGQRMKVATGIKSAVVLRLNAGIYSIISTYGDANAVARADVTVEAGKLSEITLAHSVAKVSFRLVTREGGEAIADTQWNVTTTQGDTVKDSSGALPTHYLAPGAYSVRAKHAGRLYKQDFSVKSGENRLVEVVIP